MLTRFFILTGLLITAIICNSCQTQSQAPPPEPSRKHYENPATKTFNADNEKYNIVNIELAPLNLKLVPQGTVNNGMPDMTKAVKNMPEGPDPKGIRKALREQIMNIPVLIWTDKPPTTPIPDDVVNKAMPIVKKQFPGCLWRPEVKNNEITN